MTKHLLLSEVQSRVFENPTTRVYMLSMAKAIQTVSQKDKGAYMYVS